MTKLEILQAGMDIVRRELTSALAWVLRKEYGSSWWRRGVIDTLERDGQRVDDLPIEGNEGDIDLYTALKLVRNYHFESFEKYLGWDSSLRPILNSVAECRNSYEGHVTANREAHLTRTHAQDLLQNMSILLLRLHEDHEEDSVDLMRPLAQKLIALPPDEAGTSTVQPVTRFRPPTSGRTPRSPTLNGACVIVQVAATRPPVTKPKPAISSQLDRGRTEIMVPEKPRDIHTMAPIPEYLAGSGTQPPGTLRRPRKPHPETEEEPVELSPEVWKEIPPSDRPDPIEAEKGARRISTRRGTPSEPEDLSPRLPKDAAARKKRSVHSAKQADHFQNDKGSKADRKKEARSEDPFAVVPWLTEKEAKYIQRRTGTKSPKKKPVESVFVKDESSRRKHLAPEDSLRVSDTRKAPGLKKPGARAWIVWILAPILTGFMVWFLMMLGEWIG